MSKEKRTFNWQHIMFAHGGNPYICKTEKEFQRLQRKYLLVPTNARGFWVAKDR